MIFFNKALLHKSDVMEEVLIGHASKDNVFRDFCDGSYIQNHPVLQQDNRLLISFYFDELEVANPLGSKRGKHKLGNLLAWKQPEQLFWSINVEVRACDCVDYTGAALVTPFMHW